MAKRETRRRQRIIKALEAEGWQVDSNPAGPSQRKGRSDLTVCAAGLYAAVEVKVDDDDLPEPAQVRYLLGVQQRGGLGFVTRDPLHAVRTIKQWIARYPVVEFDFGFLDDALGSTTPSPAPAPETPSTLDLDSWEFDPNAAVVQDDDGTVRLADAPAPTPLPTPIEQAGMTIHHENGTSDYIIPEQDFVQDTPAFNRGDLDAGLFAPGATGPVPHVSTLSAAEVTPAMQQEMVENALNGLSLADEGMPMPHAFEGFGVMERLEWKLDELCRVLGHGQISRGERPTLPSGLRAVPSHTSVDSGQAVTAPRRRGPGRPKKSE